MREEAAADGEMSKGVETGDTHMSEEVSGVRGQVSQEANRIRRVTEE